MVKSTASHFMTLGKRHVGSRAKFIAVCKADESDERVEGFIPDLEQSPLLNGQTGLLFEEYCRELASIGITFVWHNVLQGERSTHFTSHNTWAHRCLEGGYPKFDVLDQVAFRRNENIFFWRDLNDLCDRKQKSLMDERDVDYGIRNGVTLSFDHHTYHEGRYETAYTESISFATDSKTFDLPDFCLANYPLINAYLEEMTRLSRQILEETQITVRQRGLTSAGH